MEGWTAEDRGLGTARELVIAGGVLRLRLEPSRPEVELAVAGVRGPLRLAPRLELRDAAAGLVPGAGRSLAVGELRALAGPVWRVEIQSVGAARAGLRWTLEVPRSGDGVVLSLGVENRSPQPLHVAALVPAALVGERQGTLALPPSLRAWRLAARGDLLAPFARREPVPRGGRLAHAGRGPVLLRGHDAPSLLAGFTTHGRSSTQIRVEGDESALRVLELRCPSGGRRLAPGETLESERAWLGLGGHAGALLAEWARRCGLESGAPPRRPLVLVRSDRVPGGAEAQALHALGVGALEHPNSHPLGRPPSAALAAWLRGCREGELLPALRLTLHRVGRGPRDPDLERPESRARLRASLAELAALGAGAFTLEGLDRARRSAPGGGPGALRDLLAELRAAAGAEAWLLPEMGAPPGPGLGRLDALALADAPPCAPLVLSACRAFGGVEPASLSDAAGRSRLVARAALATRAALGDPGPLDLACGSLAAAEARLSLAALVAGVLRLRGDPARLEPARGAALRRALPLLARPGFPADLDAAGGARTLVVPLLGGRLAVLLLAPEGASTQIGVELGGLGVAGPHHVFDFWPGRYLGVLEDRVPVAPVAGGGCRLLALTPVAARPQLVGSTLHVGMGTLEGFALEQGPGGALRVELRLPGEREGEIWIASAASRSARALAVRFRDAGSFELPPPGG